MVDLDWKTKMVKSDNILSKSSRLSEKLQVTISSKIPAGFPVDCSSEAACSAYEAYLRLPELRKLWSSRDFPAWDNEPILKPALQALEITFRLVSAVLSDKRPYGNRREWSRRLESLAADQIGIVAEICDGEEAGAPISDSGSGEGGSLLQRLTAWYRTEDVAQKIIFTVECEMRRSRYTLGVGEQNLAGKPYLKYDAVCRPNDLCSLKNNPYIDQIDNHENQILYTTHQILESWICVSRNVIKRVVSEIEAGNFQKASADIYLVERIWKLLAEIEDLHFLMDPDDFLKLKNQLQIKTASQNDAFCFRSRGLVEITKLSKDLSQTVPRVLEVEVDPTGGPRVQVAAMRLYGKKNKREENFYKVHLLQGMQAVEASVKRFFYSYRTVVAAVMGSVEANTNRGSAAADSGDSLARIFLEPTYFPSLDAAKTFLGEFWSNHHQGWKK